MDDIDRTLLGMMQASGGTGIVADAAHKTKLDGLVTAGLAVLEVRKPMLPGYPIPPPLYRITERGQLSLKLGGSTSEG